LIENYAPQPYPLWCIRLRPDPDSEESEIALVLGWSKDDKGVLRPVVRSTHRLGDPAVQSEPYYMLFTREDAAKAALRELESRLKAS
jgi:hypothetical protein